MASKIGFEDAVRILTRMNCVVCPDETPSCPPSCPAGQVCSIVSQTCSACASSTCVPQALSGNNPQAPPPSPASNGSGGPNVGAIAGGVVGGVVFIALIVFVVYWFFIRNRREEWIPEDWEEEDQETEKNGARSTFTMQPGPRASTHTIGSIASTVFTRASNIIQIAYIPGVTNRDQTHSPSILVPPVPPIPAVGGGTLHNREAEHYFMPGDLRDSTYSASTNDDQRSTRSSRLRTSITPSLARSSFAPTMYHDKAVVSPMPAQTMVRGKANVVSVKSNSNNSPAQTPGEDVPPIPAIDMNKVQNKKANTNLLSPDSHYTDQSPRGSSATSSDFFPRPIPLSIAKIRAASRNSQNMKSALRPNTTYTTSSANLSEAETPRASSFGIGRAISGFSTDSELSHSRANRSTQCTASTLENEQLNDDDDDPHARSRQSLTGWQQEESSSASGSVHERSLNVAIENATNRASLLPKHGGFGSEGRNESPFDDKHEMK